MKVSLVYVVALLAVTSDALRLTSKLAGRNDVLIDDQQNEQYDLDAEQTVEATTDMMRWWKSAEQDAPLQDKYLMFSLDDGGLNNIRIGWEFAGLIAKRSGRTLVLPPASPIYLLDVGPTEQYGDVIKERRPKLFNKGSKTMVEDLINLKQLKGRLATLTWEEFEQKTGKNWRDAKKASKDMAEAKECHDLDGALQRHAKDEIIFFDGKKRQPFDCGEFWKLGGPRDEMRSKLKDQDWALLTHGFVWHQDAFNIASKVVHYLGFWRYNALHARYGDLQFKESRQEPSDIFTKWPALLQDGAKVYVASDAPEKFKTAGDHVFVWDDFFSEKTGKLLAEEKLKYEPERWFKLTGLVEELICTYSNLFVGTQASTFTGHIQRMRLHADSPNRKPYYHTAPEPVAVKMIRFKPIQRQAFDKGNVFLQLN